MAAAQKNAEKEGEFSRLSRIDAVWYHAVPVSINQMKNILKMQYKYVDTRKWATWLIGESGIGKNHLQEQAAAELGIEYLWFPCKGIQPEDLRGFPALVRRLEGNGYGDDIAGIKNLFYDYYKKEPSYSFVQLQYLQKAFQPGWTGFIHLDEFAQAAKEVQEMIYMLFYDRRLDDQYLSDGAMLIASMNPPQVNDYMLSKIGKASQDRTAIYKIEATSSEWLQWARAKKLNPTLVDFVADHPYVFDHNKGRRLAHFSDMLNNIFPIIDPNNMPYELKIVAHACIRIDDADMFAKYVRDVFEISGLQILSGDKKAFKKLEKMLGSGEKAVHLYRVQQEMIRGMQEPAEYLKDLIASKKGNMADVWEDVAENTLDYIKLLRASDLDSAVGLLKEVTRLQILDIEDRLNLKFRDKKNAELYKEVLRCLSFNINNQMPENSDLTTEAMQASS